MNQPAPAFDISVTRVVPAPPEIVFALVTDVVAMADLSPETVSVRWLEGDAATVGSRFKGRNRLGLTAWSTVATVTAVDPGRSFSFATGGPSRSTWTYDVEPTAGGTRITESVTKQDDQIAPIRLLQRLAGVRDRRAHLRAGMATTLERLAAAVTAPA